MLTQEQKMAICEEYRDKTKKVNEIAKRYGILRAKVAQIAVELGAEPRTKKYGKKLKSGNDAHVCPKCRKTVDIKGAKFCCYCGSDIRTDSEILCERINGAMPKIMLLPTQQRDEMQQLLCDIKKKLKGVKEQ